MKCKKTVAMFCGAFMLSCFVPTLGYAMNSTKESALSEEKEWEKEGGEEQEKRERKNEIGREMFRGINELVLAYTPVMQRQAEKLDIMAISLLKLLEKEQREGERRKLQIALSSIWRLHGLMSNL